MDDIDPYFSVQDEIFKNISTVKAIYEEWQDCNDMEKSSDCLIKLRQLLKVTEWDLLELQETVEVVENNPSKFSLSDKHISERRRFLNEARNVIKQLKERLIKSNDKQASKTPLDFTVHTASPIETVSISANVKASSQTGSSINTVNSNYQPRSKRPNGYKVSTDPLGEQEQLLLDQDNKLNQLGASISTLKGMSRRIGDELGDQIVLLDDFSSEMAHTETRLDSVTKRTARLLHLGSDRRQWCAIVSLCIILFIILILLAVL